MTRYQDILVKSLLWTSAFLAVLVTAALVLVLALETFDFLKVVPLSRVFGTFIWNPDRGFFSLWPLLSGTFLIMVIALLIAMPLGVAVAIYLNEYASKSMAHILRPGLCLLAGIPTLVYGFLAAVVVSPFIYDLGQWLNLDIAAESSLGVGMVMGMMIVPFVGSLCDQAIQNIPQHLKDHGFALGSTKSEIIIHIVLPAALPGIVSSGFMAMSRAIGETMLVLMAAGLNAKMSLNPFDALSTMTVQIVSLLTGDQDFNSSKTLSAFALGFFLLLMTLVFNILSVRWCEKYRQRYGGEG
jgi:phosphate transport system permease protein